MNKPIPLPMIVTEDQLRLRPRFVIESAAAETADKKLYTVSPNVRVEYQLAQPLRQARFDRRVALLPLIDLSAFRFKAVVDFVKIRAHSTGHVNFSQISRWISGQSGIHASVTGDGKGMVAVRLQQPSPGSVCRLVELVQGHPALQTQGELEEIEISLDVYPRCPSDEAARWKMTEHLWRHFLPSPSVWDIPLGQPRSVYGSGTGAAYHWLWREPRADKPVRPWSRGHCETIATSRGIAFPSDLRFVGQLEPENYQQPCVNGTTYFGKKGGDIMFRVMHKILDEQGGQYGERVVLEQAGRRTRIEVNLRGDELRRNGLQHARAIGSGLRHLRKRHFKFWLPTLPAVGGALVAPAELERFRRAGVYGVRQGAIAKRESDAFLNRRVAGRVKTKPWRRTANDEHEGLMAYTQLNKRCADALRRAEKSWSR